MSNQTTSDNDLNLDCTGFTSEQIQRVLTWHDQVVARAYNQGRAAGEATTVYPNPWDYVEPCEPDCSPERHAYHQSQWEMAQRMVCSRFPTNTAPPVADEPTDNKYAKAHKTFNRHPPAEKEADK